MSIALLSGMKTTQATDTETLFEEITFELGLVCYNWKFHNDWAKTVFATWSGSW